VDLGRTHELSIEADVGAKDFSSLSFVGPDSLVLSKHFHYAADDRSWQLNQRKKKPIARPRVSGSLLRNNFRGTENELLND